MTKSRQRTRQKSGEASPPSPKDSGQAEQTGQISRPTVADAIAKVRESFGDETVRVGTELRTWFHCPTGIFAMDMALLGGIARSQMTLIYGREASGKSTLAQRICGRMQRLLPDQFAIYVDVEGTYDPIWSSAHGVDQERMILVQPHTGEQALDAALEFLSKNDCAVVVVDSLAALTPYKEAEASTEDNFPGLQARLIGKATRQLCSKIQEERKQGHFPTLLLLNQWRMKIGVFRGDPRVLPGGQSQHYAAFTKIEMLNKETMGKDEHNIDTVDFNEHTFKIIKSKAGTALRSGEFTMIRNPANPMGQGFIDDGRTVATWAKKLDMVSGGGTRWQIAGHDDLAFKNLQGIVDWFYANPVEFEAFKVSVISKYRETCGLPGHGWL